MALYTTSFFEESTGDHKEVTDILNPNCWCGPTLYQLANVPFQGQNYDVIFIKHDFSKKFGPDEF